MSASTTSPLELLTAIKSEREEYVRRAQRAADRAFADRIRDVEQAGETLTAIAVYMGMSRTNLHRLLRENPPAGRKASDEDIAA